ncbi:hypothetical protein IQ265_07535 [Nodosilinea sp. LEGE 06152]|uniref:hypothetical protein n=1 Tax=Nodosilinea sp. LEGE 06152 TaxID=2777966 RepID=UPI00187E1835|nr:hypothetical protein [Nodosilinea sp. LEGE 06152]MBE9156678.1 hypothetical protein [Nodosilinea sp. LEGE 06152]
MALKHLVSVMLGLATVSIGTVANAQAASTDPTLAVDRAEWVDSAVQATSRDNLAQEIAQLAVERVLLGVRFTQDHPIVEQLNQRQQGLEARFAELYPNDQDLLDAATASVIESKLAETELLYTANQSKYVDEHPIQQRLKAEIEALRQHLYALL